MTVWVEVKWSIVSNSFQFSFEIVQLHWQAVIKEQNFPKSTCGISNAGRRPVEIIIHLSKNSSRSGQQVNKLYKLFNMLQNISSTWISNF